MNIEKLNDITLHDGKKIFFASDVHLGLNTFEKSLEREKRFIKWLDKIKPECQVLFLLGDIFDFWYEYNKVIPRGFTRFLGKLSEFTDSGIEVHLFTGNHDIWMFDYLPAETGVILHRRLVSLKINNKSFILGHGDGVCPEDRGYRILRSIFTNKIMQFLFSRLHPNLALWFGHRWSRHSRISKGISEKYLGDDKEFQVIYAKRFLQHSQANYFIFGHRHHPMNLKLNETSHLINLGEWIHANSFASFDGLEAKLEFFTKQ
jgi:UDP-2,3-diacylglucosamine hydrolase